MEEIPPRIQELSEKPFYRLGKRLKEDAMEKKTWPWLVWSPSDTSRASDQTNTAGQTETAGELQFVEWLEDKGLLSPWEPFERIPKSPEEFVMRHYYGGKEEREAVRLTEAVLLCQQLQISLNRPVPLGEVHRIRAIREEARSRLERYAKKLRNEVMKPLRRVLVPCALETARSRGELPNPGGDQATCSDSLHQTVRGLFQLLLQNGIGAGQPLETMQADYWYEHAFRHVPEPVAAGAKEAIKVHLTEGDDTRDAILERARPVYVKGRAAQEMIASAFYDRVLIDALKEGGPSSSNDFSNLTTQEAARYGTQEEVQRRRFTLHQRIDPSERISKRQKEKLGEQFNTSHHTINNDLQHLRDEFGN